MPLLLVAALLLAWPPHLAAGARASFEAGDFAEAEAAAMQELEREPESLDALLVLGQTQLTLGRTAEGVATLRQAAEAHPQSGEAHYRLGQALTLDAGESGTWRRMFLVGDIRAAFRRAVELEPSDGAYRWALFEFCRHAPAMFGGGRRRALAHARALEETDPARGHRARAALLLQDGEVDAAERALQQAVATQPDEPDHRYALGYFYQERERWDEAFATFAEIARRFPPEVEAQFQIGKTAAMSGRRLEAGIAALQRYLRYKPKAGEPPLAWAQYRLGMLHEHRRDRAAARAAYAAALQLDPRLGDARSALAALDG